MQKILTKQQFLQELSKVIIPVIHPEFPLFPKIIQEFTQVFLRILLYNIQYKYSGVSTRNPSWDSLIYTLFHETLQLFH